MYIPNFQADAADENQNSNWVFTNPKLGEDNTNPTIYDNKATDLVNYTYLPEKLRFQEPKNN